MHEIEQYKLIMDEIVLSDEMEKKLLNMSSQQEKKIQFLRPSLMKAIACLTLLIAISGTAYATYRYLSMPEVAKKVGNNSWEELFKSDSAKAVYETQKCNNYDVTYIGMTSSSDLEKSNLEGNYEKDRMYSVIAIKRTDGRKMSEEELEKEFFVTPVIAGVNPQKVNSYQMDSSMVRMIHDGVMYLLHSQKDIEIFANKKVQLAVNDGTRYNPDAFIMEKDSVVKRNPDYKGVNALFSIPLDSKLADDAKADAQIRFWMDTSDEQNTKNAPMRLLSNLPASAQEVFLAFNQELCVINQEHSNGLSVSFYAKDGKSIAYCQISSEPYSHVKTYSTPNYVTVLMSQNEKTQFVLINQNHKIVKRVELDGRFEKDNQDEMLICPEQEKLIYEHLGTDKKGQYFEICSCNYDGKEKNSLYKVYDLEPESAGKVSDIDEMNLSKDGKTVFFTGQYFESLESGSDSKHGVGYINIEKGTVKFIRGGNDAIAGTLDKQAFYFSSSAENSNIVILEANGKMRTVNVEHASELPYVYLSEDGKKFYTVSETSKQPVKNIIKCYSVEKNKCIWTKTLAEDYCVNGIVDQNQLFILCFDQKENASKIFLG